MSAATLTAEDLAAAASEALYPTIAARRFGVSRASIYRAETCFGIRLPRAEKDGVAFGHDYRAAVQDMRPLDAVEFLLEVIEALRRPVRHEWSWPEVKLTRCERLLLFAIAQRNGGILSRDAGMQAIMAGREAEDGPSDKTMDVFVSKLRQKLRSHGVGIVTHFGVGWSISAPAGFVWPWERAAS